MVRPITASHAAKIYTCPGCSTAVPPGMAHLVVWQDGPPLRCDGAPGWPSAAHWHANCWQLTELPVPLSCVQHEGS